MEFLDVNQQALFAEVVERGRAQGVTDQGAYNELVDTIVQEKLQVGEMDEDSALPKFTTHLQGRWEDYQAELGI